MKQLVNKLFGGRTFIESRDGDRLRSQMTRVCDIVLNSGDEWWTLSKLSQLTGDPEASISARLRDLRKAKFGGYILESKYVRRGLWEYRVAE